MSDQIAFPFDADYPSKRTPRQEMTREDHEGDCKMELDRPPTDHEISSVLRCSLARHHRVALEPGSRQQVMKELLSRGLLVGKALAEAETWAKGKTPYGFITRGG